MNDKPNDTLITLFPTLIMKCSDFLSKSEIDEIFEILKSKPKEQHDTLAIGGKSSHGMGMSNDFEIALKCGATHIRIGTKIFGERN